MNLSEYFLQEIRDQNEVKSSLARNLINFNSYFKYSGKEEKTTPLVAYMIEKERKYNRKYTRTFKNDMSKYKLKKY
tara:strand:- start:15196 stop:15423 length:228 start_codon:yes stop_codon:yes gene_type:complete